MKSRLEKPIINSRASVPASLSQPALVELLEHCDIWQGSQRRSTNRSTNIALSSGYPSFDRVLHLAGWPKNRLIEILTEQHSIGEMQLILPAIAKQMELGGWLFLIEPPFIPYAPAWLKAGVPVERVMVIQSCNNRDELWACEQIMANASVAACLFWPVQDYLSHKHLKRLQLASQKGSALNFIFRSSKMAQQSSAASLRLLINKPIAVNRLSQASCQARHRKIELSILKQPAGWSGQALQLEIPLDGQPLDYKIPNLYNANMG